MKKSILWPFNPQNEFYSMVKLAKLPHGAITVLALLGIIFLSLIPAGIIVLIIRVAGMDVPLLVSSFLQFISFILAVWLYISVVEKRSFKSLGFFGLSKFKKYIGGFLIGISLLTASFVIVTLMAKTNVEVTFRFGVSSVVSIITVLIFFIIQGASEEIVFRGWLMQSIGVRHWPWLGITLSTLFFAILHAANPNFNLIAGMNILLVGLLLAMLALYDGNLWGVCGFHTAWNFTMNSVYGINVSGTKLVGDTLLKTTFEGSPLITGGDFGLEGSLIVTALIVALTVVLLFIKRKG